MPRWMMGARRAGAGAPRSPLVALSAALIAGCAVDGGPADQAGMAPPAMELAASGEWEPTAHPIKLAREPIADSMDIVHMNEKTRVALERAALDDASWYAADGERYEALYIAPTGESFGRRGPARKRPAPDKVVGRGFAGIASDVSSSQEEIEAAIEAAESGLAPDRSRKARIGTDWTIDRRSRISTEAQLTGVPLRMVGAMSADGDTAEGGCTGTKIGPRAVLTAAHCVMGSDGDVSLNGWFNPGQTNTDTPNGSIHRNGVFLRDWRIHRKYDYAVVFLDDSPAVVGLGWLGVAFWNSAASYEGRGASLHGYPCGPGRDCGQTSEQRCKASPRADKRCDGWMYSHSANLWDDSFRDDELLQYDNDMSSGQSGSSVYVQLSPGDRRVVAVNTHSWNGVSMGPRFRSSMWEDVCDWIAAKPSAFGEHSACN